MNKRQALIAAAVPYLRAGCRRNGWCAGRRDQRRRQGVSGLSQKHMLILAAAVAAYFMYKQHKAANVLNDRYPMAYKS